MARRIPNAELVIYEHAAHPGRHWQRKRRLKAGGIWRARQSADPASAQTISFCQFA